MQKQRPRFLKWWGVMVLVGVLGGGHEAGAQFRDFTWGYYGGSRESSRLGREDLIAREGFCPTGGCVLHLDKVEVLPPQGRQGDTLSLITTYSILTPEQVAMPITITREIFFQGKSLGRTKSMETRQLNGTWTQEVDFKLPPNAAVGTYTLNTRITTGYAQEQKSCDFRVY